MALEHLKTPIYQTMSRAIDSRVADAIQMLGKSLPCYVIKVSGTIVTVSFDVNIAWTLPQVEMPVAGWEYIRAPIQAGDRGYAVPCDLSLGGTSGLGSGITDDRLPCNLAALVFIPVGNTGFTSVDPQAVTLYGPNGFAGRDTLSKAVLLVNPTNIKATIGTTEILTDGTTITLKSGANTVVMDASQASITVGSSTITATAASVAITASAITLNGAVTIAGTLSQAGGAATMAGTLAVTGAITGSAEITGNGIPLSTHIHPGVTPGGGDTGLPI